MINNLKPNELYFKQSRSEMLKYIPNNGKNFLEFGCGIGNFGNLVKSTYNVNYWAVEMHQESAETAANVLDKVIISSIENSWDNLPDNYFDCIIFNDVLEHLVDPYSVLLSCKKKLNDDGVIVSSIPNVRYLTNLYNLIIRKDWKYEDCGILDITHLRFFTEKSILRMWEELGFEVEMEGINKASGFKFKLFDIFTFGFFSDIMSLQYACVAKKK